MRIGAEDGSQAGDKVAWGRRREAEKGQKILMAVYVVPARKERGGGTGLCCKVPGEGREEGRGLPGECREGLLVELRAAEANEVGALSVEGGAEDRRPVRQRVVDGRPIHLVQVGTVAPDGNNALVSLREGVSHGVGEARPEVVPPLLRPVDFQDREAAVGNGLAGVLIEGLGHLPILCIVLSHEPLVLPLLLGAVAEEQDGGMVAVGTDGGRSQSAC